MASLDLTSADAALKQLYKDKNFRISVYDRRPILGTMPKDEGFFGRNMPLVNQYGNAQGVSASFATAQAAATSAKMEDFLLTRINMHITPTIDGETLEAMSNDSGAFLTAMQAQIDSAKRALADRLESLLPGSGTGTLGQISAGSTVSTATITLLNINDVVNFEVGTTVVASAADGGSLDTGSTTGEVVKTVNRRTGDLGSTSAAWNTVISGIAASHYLAAKGDAQAGGSKVVPTGLGGWLPATTPSAAENFFGVDRSVDSRLYGNLYDASANTLEEGLINGDATAAREGGKVNTYFLNHVIYRQLVNELGAKVQYTKTPARGANGKEFGAVGFGGVAIMGLSANEIDVMAANKIPSSVAYGLEIETWKLCSIGPAVKFNDLDGMKVLRQSSNDGVEARLVFRGNLGCVTPSYNVRVKIS